MLTQAEQLKQASKAYLVPLNDPRDASSTFRYAVYLLRDGELEVLWPSDSDQGAKSQELLGLQVYSKRQKYPAYHFAVGGYGYSKQGAIASDLRRVNPELSVYSLEWGGTPSRVSNG